MGKNQKDVKPISARKMGELARLLEERGVDGDIFQRTMIENPDGLCFFLRGRFGQLVNKKLHIKQELNGYMTVVSLGSSFVASNDEIIAVSRNLYDFAMGNIILVGDDVTYDNGTKEGKKGKVIKIDFTLPRSITTSDDYYRNLDDIICVEFSSGRNCWTSLKNLGF